MCLRIHSDPMTRAVPYSTNAPRISVVYRLSNWFSSTPTMKKISATSGRIIKIMLDRMRSMPRVPLSMMRLTCPVRREM